jgi:hypothetical protein
LEELSRQRRELEVQVAAEERRHRALRIKIHSPRTEESSSPTSSARHKVDENNHPDIMEEG